MATLKSNEILALMKATRQIYACRDQIRFAKVAVESITQLIHADRADLQLYTSSKNVQTLYRDHTLPGDDDREIWFKEHMTDHPIVAHAVSRGDLGPHMLCDFVTQRVWRQSEFYSVCCREPADNFLLCGAVTVDFQQELSVSLVRRLAGFNDHERLMLELIQDHLAQAWENLQHATGLDQLVEWLERGLEISGRSVVVLDDAGRVHTLNRQSVEVIRRHFPSWRGPQLPLPLDGWLGAHLNALSGSGNKYALRTGHGSQADKQRSAKSTDPSTTLYFQSSAGELLARFYPACDARGQPAILSLEENSPEADVSRLQSLGLTPRQAQTLYWMTQGKSNQEIAVILSVRPRTVDKFVETLFDRLNVCNRLDAAMLARDALLNSAR